MFERDENTRKINRIIRPIATLIIATVLALMIPILSGVVALPFFLIGQPEAYIVSRIIQNLYGPIIVTVVITLLQSAYYMFSAARNRKQVEKNRDQNTDNNAYNNTDKSKLGFGYKLKFETKLAFKTKLDFKNIIIATFFLALMVYITFSSFKNLGNLIMDIGIIATADYAKEDGILELYEAPVGDDTQTFMEINGIKFSGGNALLGELVAGDYYHVEYLPHTKYVAKYTKIK